MKKFRVICLVLLILTSQKFAIAAQGYPPDRATSTPTRPAIVGSDGTLLDLESWLHTYSYNGDSTLNYEEVTDGGSTWRRTYTYSSGLLTGVSVWVRQ